MKHPILFILFLLFITSFICGYTRIIPLQYQRPPTGNNTPGEPKYTPGDIIEVEPSTRAYHDSEMVNENLVWIILDYDPKTDDYKYTMYWRNTGEIVEKYIRWKKRSIIETIYPVKLGHIELSSPSLSNTTGKKG